MKKVIGIILMAFTLFGCTLPDGYSRKVTAYGIWGEWAGAVIGIGYWHSEIGPSGDIQSEQSDKPGDTLRALPVQPKL